MCQATCSSCHRPISEEQTLVRPKPRSVPTGQHADGAFTLAALDGVRTRNQIYGHLARTGSIAG